MNYRLYQSSETQAVIQLFKQTFTDSEGANEGQIIADLVAELIATTPSEDLQVCVAEIDGEIAGSILLTRLRFDDEAQCFLVAPVAVHPTYQKQKVGQNLLNFGLTQLREQGVKLAFTYGDPNYYSKVGFEVIDEADFNAPLPLSFPHGWQAQSLTEQPLTKLAGTAVCVAGFHKPELW